MYINRRWLCGDFLCGVGAVRLFRGFDPVCAHSKNICIAGRVLHDAVGCSYDGFGFNICNN